MSKLTPCLWFDTEGEEAAGFYTSVFPNSQVVEVTRYGAAGPRPRGTVMTVSFELDGQPFIALNGGPEFTFSEAVSFQVDCEDQAEVDTYWEQLSEGGEEGPCGWLKDRFGALVADRPDRPARAARRSRPGEVAARDGGDDADAEDRDRGARAGCRGRVGSALRGEPVGAARHGAS